MSELASAIVAINAQLPSARGGLPEELFLLASRLIPMINVNLLIRDEAGRTLLTWRADCFYGPGWHIPGGIIRFKEPIAERIEAVVHTELGAGVGFEPLTMTEIFADHRDVRGHFISLLYTCRLTTPPDPVLACDGQPTPGCWQWFDRCPENIIEVHKRVSHLISPAQGTRPNYSVKPERGIMNQAAKIETPQGAALTADEQAKRNQLMARKPYVAKKLARISEMDVSRSFSNWSSGNSGRRRMSARMRTSSSVSAERQAPERLPVEELTGAPILSSSLEISNPSRPPAPSSR